MHPTSESSASERFGSRMHQPTLRLGGKSEPTFPLTELLLDFEQIRVFEKMPKRRSCADQSSAVRGNGTRTLPGLTDKKAPTYRQNRGPGEKPQHSPCALACWPTFPRSERHLVAARCSANPLDIPQALPRPCPDETESG